MFEGSGSGRRFPCRMKLPLFRFALVVGILSGAATLQGQAVQGLTMPSFRPGGESVPPAARFDVEFHGGPLEAFLDNLREASADPVNVIVPPGLENEPMPPMRLRAVSVAEVLMAVGEASPMVSAAMGGQMAGRSARGGDTRAYGFRPASNGPNPVWVFWKSVRPEESGMVAAGAPAGLVGMEVPPPPSPPMPPERVRVLNLRRYLDGGLSVEDITTAIRTACELLPDGGQPKLTFHQETSLLICRGRVEQLELVKEVLAQLEAPSGRGGSSGPGTGGAAASSPSESPRTF